MRKKRKLKSLNPKTRMLVFSILVLWLGVMGTLLVYNHYVLLDITEVSVFCEVVEGKRAGFNVDTTALWYGRMSPGMYSERFVDVKNPYDFPVTAKLYSSGMLGDYLSFAENNVDLAPGEVKPVTVRLTAPQFTGNLTGKVTIKISK